MPSSLGVTGHSGRPASSDRKARCLSPFPVAKRIGVCPGVTIVERACLEDTGDSTSGGAVSPFEFQWQCPEFELFAHQLVQVDQILYEWDVLA